MIEESTEVAQALHAVTRAAASGRTSDQLLAHRNGFHLGSRGVAPLIETLNRFDWSQPGRKEGVAIITALALLLHDVDEPASRNYFAELLAKSTVHPLFAQRIKTVLGYASADYVQASLGNTVVLVHKSLPDAEETARLVVSSLALVPPTDLAGVERVYVVPKEQDRYWGTYLRILSRVVIVWRGRHWLQRLHAQTTLFHEVGHHVASATDEPPSERELAADRYAYALLAASAPILSIPVLRHVFGGLLFGANWPQVTRSLQDGA